MQMLQWTKFGWLLNAKDQKLKRGITMSTPVEQKMKHHINWSILTGFHDKARMISPKNFFEICFIQVQTTCHHRFIC